MRNIGIRHKHQLPPKQAPTKDQTPNLSMWPDGESNMLPFGMWDHTPTN